MLPRIDPASIREKVRRAQLRLVESDRVETTLIWLWGAWQNFVKFFSIFEEKPGSFSAVSAPIAASASLTTANTT